MTDVTQREHAHLERAANREYVIIGPGKGRGYETPGKDEAMPSRAEDRHPQTLSFVRRTWLHTCRGFYTPGTYLCRGLFAPGTLRNIRL